MNEMNYLSDEELEKLISEVEENEIVIAPPQLRQDVLRRLEENAISTPGSKSNIRRFRIQVVASMAAMLVIIFGGPFVRNAINPNGIANERWQSSRKISEKLEQKRVERKEEMKERKGEMAIFGNLGSASNIFTEDDFLNIFGR